VSWRKMQPHPFVDKLTYLVEQFCRHRRWHGRWHRIGSDENYLKLTGRSHTVKKCRRCRYSRRNANPIVWHKGECKKDRKYSGNLGILARYERRVVGGTREKRFADAEPRPTYCRAR
jgi:hypothetical protein